MVSAQAAITVEGLGKRYRIGRAVKRPDSLRQALTQALGAPFRYLRYRLSEQTEADTIWALRNVTFTVGHGEVLGIIGRNGAGKSTLLKILSRITDPSEGRALVRGRVNSLLEVGTGFHPELTGRENIYMNAALHGMRRSEIAAKLDEIVDFAEIGKFLDTPVKRYSSGMYTRLAFAVAAHLEPDVLIVDEVLAVGDAEFQRRCLSKMDAVSKTGRTILFVSHNMAAIQGLCARALLLEKGQLVMNGEPAKVVAAYLGSGTHTEAERVWRAVADAPGTDDVRVHGLRVLDRAGHPCSRFDVRDPITLEISYWVLHPIRGLNTSFCLYNQRGEIILHSRNDTMNMPPDHHVRQPGHYVSRCFIPGDFMNDGQVIVQAAVTDAQLVHFLDKESLSFQVTDRMDPEGVRGRYLYEWPPAAVRPRLDWTTEQTNHHAG